VLESDGTVAGEKSEITQADTAPRGRLVAAYLGAAALGYVLGAEGALPFPETSTPLARVGFALREPSTSKSESESSDAWAALARDVDQVRLGWTGPETATLDLVIAVRGLTSGGHPEWTRAEELCKALKWSRCDRSSLEELARRSRP